VALAALLTLSLLPARPAQAVDAVNVVKWGAVVAPYNGNTRQEGVRDLETKVGRKFAGLRTYARWNSTWPTPDDHFYAAGGRDVWLSVNPEMTDGSELKWADIAAARKGSPLHKNMVSWAQRVKAFGSPMYVTMNHEPETHHNTRKGTPADYIAAFRKFVTIFRNQGVTNAKYVHISTAFGFSPGFPRPAKNYFPGDAYVDYVGADGYNWLDCRGPNETNPPRSFDEIFDRWRTWAVSTSTKPLVIPEWASGEYSTDPQYKANWIAQTQQALKGPKWDRLHYIMYYQNNGPRCHMHVESSPQALTAFRAMGQDPYYGPAVPAGQ